MHQPSSSNGPDYSSGHAPGYGPQGYGPPASPPPRKQFSAGVIVLLVAGCLFGGCITCSVIGGVVGVVAGTTSTSGGQSPDATVPAPGLASATSSGATTARVVQAQPGEVDSGATGSARPDATAGEPPVPRVASPEPGSPTTELSRRAHLAFRVRRDEPASRQAGRDINREPTRAEVIEVLGPATWAALPGDKGGDFAIEASSSVLDLYWRNGDCTPVMASFDKSMRTIGSYDGRMCVGGQDLNPGARYSCTQHDRQKLCR